MKITLAYYESLYPKKLDLMRSDMERSGKQHFTPTQMQKLHDIGYNHAMHVISYGIDAGVIHDPSGRQRYQFTHPQTVASNDPIKTDR